MFTIRQATFGLFSFRRAAVLVLLSCLALQPAAAGGQSESADAAPGQAETADRGATQGEATDSLVIYTYDAFPEGLESIIADHFQESYGVDVTLERFTDTGGLYNEVYLTRNEFSADVVIGLDNTYIGQALSADLFQPYRPEGIEAVREDLVLDTEYRLVPFDYGNVVLNYDSQAISDPPETFEELLDPRFEESIVLMNPATSSPGRNFLLLTINQFGEEGYLDFWRQLKPNILTITSGWSEGYGLYTQGEAPIVLSYETSPAYHIEYEDSQRYRNLILNGVGYGQIEVAGILENAQNLVNARRAMDFIVSERFQREIPLNQFMFPAREDVDLPESYKQVDRPSETVFMDVDRVDENFETWLTDWEAVMR